MADFEEAAERAPKRLAGRVYVVSGSTTGVGEGIARMIAAEGGAVVIHGIEQDLADKVVGEICEAGGRATVCLADLQDATAPRRVIDHCIETFGALDGMVNNAGVSARADIETTTPEVYDWIMAINVRAPLFFVQAALPHLRKSSAASIVNIGSLNAYCGWTRLLPYSMSKGAMMTMTRNMSVALAKDRIRVNQLNIGWTLTPNEYELQKRDGQPENWPDFVPIDKIPMGRMMTPEDVAKMVCFLLSPDGELVSGSVIDFNQFNMIGGYVAT